MGFFINFDENYSTVMTSASLLRDPKWSEDIIEGLEVSALVVLFIMQFLFFEITAEVLLSYVQIKVLLKDKRKMEGVVQHCSLRYNVALISIKNFRAPHPVKLDFMAKEVT